jgi:mannose-6-phosphate isomerase-like protein (cupin superfamily)
VSYTIRNLREIEDLAAKFGYSDTQEARFAVEDLDAEATGVSLQIVRPGRRQAFAHRHQQAEEIYVVIAGGGKVKLDDEVIEIREMDAVRISPPVGRAFEAGPDGLELLVFGPRYAGDAQMIKEEFWGD